MKSSSDSARIPPSGEQFELAFGAQQAVVVEVGGGLRHYSVRGHDLLDGYAADEMCTSGRGQLLLPWPNRIEDGSYEFGGRRHQLALTEPEHGNAIHGLVRWASWKAFGSGAHPYLTLGTETVDDLMLQVPARTILRSNERGIPVGEETAEGTGYDFTQARTIAAAKLDTAFTTFQPSDDGLTCVELREQSSGDSLTLWVDESYRYLMVFTGDALADVNRGSVAIEPMTCPPNAFRTGTDLITLEPGSTWTGAWGIGPTARS